MPTMPDKNKLYTENNLSVDFIYWWLLLSYLLNAPTWQVNAQRGGKIR